MRKRVAISFLLGLVLVVGCGKKSGSNEPPPAQPATGSPVAAEAKGFKVGSDRGGSVDVKLYNFTDKKVAQYMLLFRYSDAGGNVLKVKEGTPFEKDHDFMSLSGKRFTCQPKSWCSFKVDNLDVPAKTAKVEVLVSDVTALKDDIHFEDKPLFHMSSMEWPGAAGSGSAGSAEGSAGSAEGSGSAAAPAEGSGSAGSAEGSGSAAGSAG
jgi:hypothetical protein